MRHAEIEALSKGFAIDSPQCTARPRVDPSGSRVGLPVTKHERMRAMD